MPRHWMPQHPKQMQQHPDEGSRNTQARCCSIHDTRVQCRNIQNKCRGMRRQTGVPRVRCCSIQNGCLSIGCRSIQNACLVIRMKESGRKIRKRDAATSKIRGLNVTAWSLETAACEDTQKIPRVGCLGIDSAKNQSSSCI